MQTGFANNSFIAKQQVLQNLMQQIAVLQKQCELVLNQPVVQQNFVPPNHHKLSPFALVLEQGKKTRDIAAPVVAPVVAQAQAQAQELKVNKQPTWHLASHKLFRDALQKQIFVCLHESFFSKYLLKLRSIGIDVHMFSKKMENFLYNAASRLEDYLEYSTLRQRIVTSFHIVKRKCIPQHAV